MSKVTISDKTIGGDLISKIELSFNSECITLQELITARVTKEIEEYQVQSYEQYKGFFNITKKELRLNGPKNIAKTEVIDIEKQVYIALDAFTKNSFFVLVDEEQIEDLNQEIFVNKITNVSFIKLIPLIGG